MNYQELNNFKFVNLLNILKKKLLFLITVDLSKKNNENI